MPKTVHCIRHGQSTFNAHWEHAGGSDPLHFDAPLSDLGQQQVGRRQRLRCAMFPMSWSLRRRSPGRSRRRSGCSQTIPRLAEIRVECLHRERLENSCDVGRSPVLLGADYPRLAFEHLEEVWWYRDGEPDGRGIVVEPDAVLTERVRTFRHWLLGRPEGIMAVVGHGTFFYHLTGRQLRNCEIATLEL